MLYDAARTKGLRAHHTTELQSSSNKSEKMEYGPASAQKVRLLEVLAMHMLAPIGGNSGDSDVEMAGQKGTPRRHCLCSPTSKLWEHSRRDGQPP